MFVCLLFVHLSLGSPQEEEAVQTVTQLANVPISSTQLANVPISSSQLATVAVQLLW